MVKGQMDMVEKFAVGLIVNNRFGVLNRIAGLYAKRCYNIDSLSVGETENPEFSDLCAKCGLTFIGPTGDVIRKMGNKAAARALLFQLQNPSGEN